MKPFKIDTEEHKISAINRTIRLKSDTFDRINELAEETGVSFNKIFAKLGSDYKKPDATTVITRENVMDILQAEVGKIFALVLEHAGVYKRTPEGTAAFQRFIDYVNQEEDA